MMQENIKDMKKKVDFVAVFIHWGPTHSAHGGLWARARIQGFEPTPTEIERFLNHTIVDAGADLVIGARRAFGKGMENL